MTPAGRGRHRVEWSDEDAKSTPQRGARDRQHTTRRIAGTGGAPHRFRDEAAQRARLLARGRREAFRPERETVSRGKHFGGGPVDGERLAASVQQEDPDRHAIERLHDRRPFAKMLRQLGM